MKKLIIAGLLSISCVSVFAVECTKKEYEPYFSGSSDRYIYSSSSINGDVVFDKNSVKYDKQKQIAKVWTIHQMKTEPQIGYWKIYYELDIKNNRYRGEGTAYLCNGKTILDEKKELLADNRPESAIEILHKDIKNYLGIK